MIYHTPFNLRKTQLRIWSGTTWLTLPKAHAKASQMAQDAFWLSLGIKAAQNRQNPATRQPRHIV